METFTLSKSPPSESTVAGGPGRAPDVIARVVPVCADLGVGVEGPLGVKTFKLACRGDRDGGS